MEHVRRRGRNPDVKSTNENIRHHLKGTHTEWCMESFLVGILVWYFFSALYVVQEVGSKEQKHVDKVLLFCLLPVIFFKQSKIVFLTFSLASPSFKVKERKQAFSKVALNWKILSQHWPQACYQTQVPIMHFRVWEINWPKTHAEPGIRPGEVGK